MTAFADVADMPEDDRIDLIGRFVTTRASRPVLIAVDDEPGKAHRYIRKLTQKFPTITEWEILDGIVPNTLSIKVWPPEK